MEISVVEPLGASFLTTGQDSLGSLWSSTAALDSSSSLMGVLNALQATGRGSGIPRFFGLELLPTSANLELDSAISKSSPANPSAAASDSNNLSLFPQPASLRSDNSSPAIDPLTGFSESAALIEGNIQVTTPDSDIVQNRMVFSTVNEEVRGEKTLTVKNTGTRDLSITGLSFGNGETLTQADFQIVNSPTSFTLVPDASQDIFVQFAPKGVDKFASLNMNDSPTHTKNGEQYDSLQIISDDSDQPTVTVNLAGLNSANYEGNNEPSVAEIARTFGFTFDVGTEDNVLGGSKTLLGDEVYSPYWLRADTTQPVELWPLAVYGGRGDTPHDSIKFEAKPGSGGSSGTVYTLAGRNNDDSPTGTEVQGSNDRSGGENQKLLPKVLVGGVNSIPTTSNVDFSPTSAFALNRGGAYTDDSRNGQGDLHNWRIYPVGNPDTTTWFAAVDPGNVEGFPKNYDYNDDAYLLVNAKPEFSTTLAFSAANFSVNEAGPEAEVTVVRSGNTNSAVSVTVTPRDGTAKAPGDYSNSPVQVNFASGELEATVRIPIGEDDLEEGSETINLALGNVTGDATVGPQNTTVLSVLDNDQTSFTTVNWSTTGAKPSPIGRSESVGAVANGKLYVLGGYLDSTFSPTSRSDVYNPTDKSWTPIAPLLTPLSHGATAVDETLDADGTDIYLAGGYVGKPTGGQIFATTDVWKYNVNANTWDNTLPELPEARGSGALELLGRDLHFFGGADLNRADQGTHWILNLDNLVAGWTTAASLPNPRSHLGDATLGDKIYAIGGQHGVDNKLVTQNSVHVWDPATPNIWTALAPLPQGRSHIVATTFVMGDRIIVAGGETRHGSGGTVPDVTAYKPQFDFWTALTPLPAPRHSGVAGSIGGNIFYTTGAPGFKTTTYKGIPA